MSQEQGKILDVKLYKDKNIAIMTFHQFLLDINLARAISIELDKLEKIQGPLCLITTCSRKNIYCAGLNFQIFFQDCYDDVHNVLTEYTRLLTRFTTLPFPTIACINGHCLAAGFMLIMSHDLRIVLDDQKIKMGMPEINLGMNIPEDMIAVLQTKIENDILRKICQENYTLNPQKALELKLIDKVVNEKQLIQESVEIGQKLSILAENRIAFEGIKKTLYGKYTKKAEGAKPDQISKQLVKTLRPSLQFNLKILIFFQLI